MKERAYMCPGIEKESGRPNRSRLVPVYPTCPERTRRKRTRRGVRERVTAYRICSKRRFAGFLLIIAIIAFLAGFAFAEKPVRAIETPTYAEVEIRAGDTLWRIAAEYKSEDQDIRRFIYDICQINDISASNLQPGRVIRVPVSRDRTETN